MFVILLRFAENKHLASEHMTGHNDWVRKGVDDAVFLLTGLASAEARAARSSPTASPAPTWKSAWKPTRSWPGGSWPLRSSRSSPARLTTASPS